MHKNKIGVKEINEFVFVKVYRELHSAPFKGIPLAFNMASTKEVTS